MSTSRHKSASHKPSELGVDFFHLASLGGWTYEEESAKLILTPEAARILGVPHRDGETLSVNRKQLNARIDERDRDLVNARWKEALAGHPFETTYRLSGINAETVWIWEKAQFVFDPNGKPLGAKGVVQAVSCQLQTGSGQSNIDPLTGLPNRQLLSDHLELQIPLARRQERRIAVLFIDLDGFKRVNDNFGHAMGDKLLQLVAQRMKSCLRESDMVARQGGDEFIVVLQEISADADAGIIALKLIEILGATYEIDEHRIHIGASIGIAFYPADGADADTLIQHADMAMYLSKSSGRETLNFFGTSLANQVKAQKDIKSLLASAIELNQFALNYQPVYDIQSLKVHSVECFIRWNHPQKGILEAESFIPAAEENGMIRDLGRWAVRQMLLDAASWHAKGYDFKVSVNISAAQIPEGLPLDWLKETIAQTGANPAKLIFELTEATLMRDNAALLNWLFEVEKLGIGLSLGNFGTGYSSLGFLKVSTVNYLKIDRVLVREMLKNKTQYAMVKSILDIGRNLDFKVVAEGVQDEASLKALQDMGCQLAQGFYLARPMSGGDIVNAVMQKPGNQISRAA